MKLLPDNIEGDLEAFGAFWYWINERHRIYTKRQPPIEEPWPWTDDQILREYRFCNVFRELDTVTMAFKEMFAPYADSPNLWFWYCLARQINWPETVAEIFEALGFDEWDPNIAYDVMRARQTRGEKLYTGAYMLRGDIQREGEDNNKPRYTCFRVLDPVWKGFQDIGADPDTACGHPISSTIQSCVQWLESFSGWGGFLAYEVATDLRHTRYLSAAPDIMTWANPGPGAIRGLNRVFGRKLTQALSRDKALIEMRYLLRLSNSFTEPHVPAMEMRDIEHSLCEVDKYLRVKNGEGRPRAKYRSS